VYEFLARFYDGHFFFCHGATVSELKRLANRFLEGAIGGKSPIESKDFPC
jgi:hypothetical protein